MAMGNRRGQMQALMLIAFIFIAFFFVIFIGIGVYTINIVQNQLSSIDMTVGNMTYNQTYSQGLYPALNTLKNSMDTEGIVLLFGMIVCQMIVAYGLRNRKTMWVIMDIIIIIVSFIIAVIISNTFNLVINSNSDLFQVYSQQIPTPSAFILNLYIYIPVVGILISIITYGIFKKKEVNIYGEPEY